MRWSTGTSWLVATAALTLLAGCGAGDPLPEAPLIASTPLGTPIPGASAVPDLTKPPAVGAIGSATPSASSAESVWPGGPAFAMPPGGAPGGLPVASGRIVEVEGASMWLEGEPRPMVHWAEPTTFTEFSDASKADLVVGTCARVRPSRMAGGMGQPQPQDLAAAMVTLSDAVDGICAPGPGIGPGGLAGQGPGGPGNDANRPDGSEPRYYWRPGPGPGGPGFGPGFNGLVTAVDGDSFTIETRRRDLGPSGTGAEPSRQRVTTTAETEWQRAATVDSRAVQVGKCATVMGRQAGPGHLYAESITLRPTKNDQCLREGPQRPGGPGDGRRPGFGQGPHEQPGGQVQQPRFRRGPERQGPGAGQGRPQRPRSDHRPDNRPENRPEPPSGGSGAGGGASGMPLR